MKTQAQIAAENQLASYQRGWKTGSTSRGKDPAFTTHYDSGIRGAYEQGYQDGVLAYGMAMTKAQDRYGARFTVLRATSDAAA